MGKNEVVSTFPHIDIKFRGYPDHFTEKLLHNPFEGFFEQPVALPSLIHIISIIKKFPKI